MNGYPVPDPAPQDDSGPEPPRSGATRHTGVVGHTLGGNRVLAKIGEGGMGAVFRAHDDGLDRDVAIKILPPSLARDETHLARFLREARSLARVKHPNLVQIHAVAAEKGLNFFVMELIDGESLSERIARAGALTLEEILTISGQVLSALAAVHEAGVTHRDIKSANIMIEKTGRAVLMDLGLAKDEASKGVTTDGMILGTPEYMAPEQAEGLPATPRSDIYSFGIVLYEMAAGEVPFHGKSALAILHKQCDEEPPALSGWRSDLPPEFFRAVATALRKDQDERPAGAAELASLLLAAGRAPELESLAARAGAGAPVSDAATLVDQERLGSTAHAQPFSAQQGPLAKSAEQPYAEPLVTERLGSTAHAQPIRQSCGIGGAAVREAARNKAAGLRGPHATDFGGPAESAERPYAKPLRSEPAGGRSLKALGIAALIVILLGLVAARLVSRGGACGQGREPVEVGAGGDVVAPPAVDEPKKGRLGVMYVRGREHFGGRKVRMVGISAENDEVYVVVEFEDGTRGKVPIAEEPEVRYLGPDEPPARPAP